MEQEKITQGLQFGYCDSAIKTGLERKVRKSPYSGPIHGEFSGSRLQFESMPSTHKKVIVRKMDRDSVSGYVSPASLVVDGKIEVLNTSGTVIAIELKEIKGVYFVREFGDSESLTRRTFTTRPRSEGLWVRLRFKDGETLEALMPADLAMTPPEGYLLTPPDQRSNTQRVFVPRSAVESLTVLAAIGASKRSRKAGVDNAQQTRMFQE